MKRLVLVGVTLFAFVAAGSATPAASDPLVYKAAPSTSAAPLVYKAPPPAQPIARPNPVRLRSPASDNDLFRQFLEWIKTQSH